MEQSLNLCSSVCVVIKFTSSFDSRASIIWGLLRTVVEVSVKKFVRWNRVPVVWALMSFLKCIKMSRGWRHSLHVIALVQGVIVTLSVQSSQWWAFTAINLIVALNVNRQQCLLLMHTMSSCVISWADVKPSGNVLLDVDAWSDLWCNSVMEMLGKVAESTISIPDTLENCAARVNVPCSLK